MAGTGGRPIRWESVTDHPSRVKRQTKYSVGRWDESHSCWPFFFCGTSIYQVSTLKYNTAEETVQEVAGVCGR